MSKTLFSNQTVDGDSIILDSIGGYLIAKLSGNLDGGSISYEIDFHDNDFQPLISSNAVQLQTIIGVQTLILTKTGIRIKAVLSGAGASTDINLTLL